MSFIEITLHDGETSLIIQCKDIKDVRSYLEHGERKTDIDLYNGTSYEGIFTKYEVIRKELVAY